MRVLLIGKNSMTGKSFADLFSDKYELVQLGKNDAVEDYYGRKFDAVVFLAQSGDYKSVEFTKDLFEVNVNLLFKTLQSIAAKKFIYFSTGSVYKKSESGKYAVDSALATNSANPYVMSKIVGETLVDSYRAKFESIYILRPFFIYGKEQKDSMLIKSIYNKVEVGEEIKLSGENGMFFNPVYVNDVTRLTDQLLQRDDKGLQVYNVAGNDVVSLKHIVDLMSKGLKVPARLNCSDEQETTMIGEVNIPNWRPEYSVSKGLQTFFEA